MATSGYSVRDQYYAAHDSERPEDRDRLERSLRYLQEMVFHSRDMLERFLESVPEELMQQAWNQANRKGVQELDLFSSSEEVKIKETFLRDEEGKYRTMRSVTPEEILAFTREFLEEKFRRTDFLSSPEITKEYLRTRLALRESEVFSCIFLDNRHQVIEFEELFQGTIDGCSVHPREVTKRALYHNASATIFAHNHPSGNPEPSRADKMITTRLQEALKLIDVKVLDHIVVGGSEMVSLAELGYI